jgi:hypothetical protein
MHFLLAPHPASPDTRCGKPGYEAYGLAVQEALCCAILAIVSKGSGVAERATRSITFKHVALNLDAVTRSMVTMVA